VVTPNKKAWSGDLSLWEDIKTAGGEKGSLYYGESTVGAGLPILTTLKDLVETGDEIVKIEGVLSGTRKCSFCTLRLTLARKEGERKEVKGGDGPSFGFRVSWTRLYILRSISAEEMLKAMAQVWSSQARPTWSSSLTNSS